MKKLLIFALILILIPSASATTVNITIFGGNQSAAQANATANGGNNTISVQAWNTSYVKNFTIGVINKSDTFNINISNVTPFQVVELKVNGTSIAGYQAGANGMVNFTYTQEETSGKGNKTYVIAPSVKGNFVNHSGIWSWSTIYQKGNVVRDNTTTCCTFQNVSTSRAVATVYQNSNASSRIISFAGHRTGTQNFSAFAENVNPPTRLVGRFDGSTTNNDKTGMVVFVVLPGYFYKIVDETGGGDIKVWVEWN